MRPCVTGTLIATLSHALLVSPSLLAISSCLGMASTYGEMTRPVDWRKVVEYRIKSALAGPKRSRCDSLLRTSSVYLLYSLEMLHTNCYALLYTYVSMSLIVFTTFAPTRGCKIVYGTCSSSPPGWCQGIRTLRPCSYLC